MRLAVTTLVAFLFAFVACADGTHWTLENTALRLTFAGEEKGFAVESVEALLGNGARFVNPAAQGAASFWELGFRRGAKNRASGIRLSNLSSCRAKRVVRNEDGGATFVWEGLDLGVEKGVVTVFARIAFTAAGTSEWTLEVKNESPDYGLFDTRYPILPRVALSGEADALVPRKDLGARFVRKLEWGSCRPRWGCMGFAPMMMAFFKGNAGLYFAAHDSEARIKTLFVSRENDLSFETPVENGGLPGKAAAGPRYAVTVAALEGDWWSAARLYRSWALTTPWAAKGPIVARKDYPRRLAEIPLWLNIHAHPSEVSNTMAWARARFPGVPVGVHWHLWQHSGHDVNYPEYFPEQPGTRECLAFCRSIGAEAMPYTNGRLWTTTLMSYPFVSAKALTLDNGKPVVERYGTLTPPLSPMCPCTELWDRTLNGFSRRVLGLGAGSIFLDQLGANPGVACYAEDHGHPVGGGTWYFDGYQALLAKTHRNYAAKDAFLTVEGSGEEWMNVIDGYLQVTQRTAEDVPFFHAVYSGYTTYFCSPENHQDDPASFWAAQARELTWGQSLGWFHPLVLDDAEKCAMLRDLVAFRQANLDCFAYGSMVDGIRFLDPVPEQEVTWLGRKAFHLWSVKDAPLSPTQKGRLPSVVGILWRSAATGREAAFLANLSGEERTVRFVFDGSERRVALKPRELRRIDAAARTSDAYRVTVGEGDAARALPVHLALTPDGAGNWFKLPPEVFRVYDGIDHVTVGKQTFFTSFDSDAAETKVTVRPARPFKAFRIKPAAYGIPAERRGDDLVLSVPKGRKIVVELDGDTSGQLSIFSNAPAGAPTEAKRTIRFAPGLHTVANDARIRPDEHGNPVLQGLADDTVVSLDEGAVVEAAVVIAGLKNVRIEGRGMFSLLERCEGADRGFRGKLWGGFRKRALPSVYIRSGSRGVTIDGVTFVSEFRGIVARNSDDLVIRNVKNFTYTANGDGVNCVNCSNVLVDDCYLRNRRRRLQRLRQHACARRVLERRAADSLPGTWLSAMSRPTPCRPSWSEGTMRTAATTTESSA